MTERVLLAVLIIVVASLAGWLFNAAILRRRARLGLLIDGYEPGRPAILYFTAPNCLPCETVQAPALAELEASFSGRLQVFEVDATRNSTVADSWGVLSVPTTFIIDRHGRPRGVNHGVARLQRLRRQLEAIGERAPAAAKPVKTAPRPARR